MLDAPEGSRVDRRRAAVRGEILEAAWGLCREHGLAALSLRELGARVGMRAPSLYSYFASKDAIYDAMFAQGQRQMRDWFEPLAPLRTAADLEALAAAFVDFSTSEPVRYQLMFQRVLPGFEPSASSYALAVTVFDRLREELARLGVTREEHVDLWTAIITGLTDQQISNDPGGDRWSRLVGDLVAMYCTHVGVPLGPDAPRPSRDTHTSTTRGESR